MYIHQQKVINPYKLLLTTCLDFKAHGIMWIIFSCQSHSITFALLHHALLTTRFQIYKHIVDFQSHTPE